MNMQKYAVRKFILVVGVGAMVTAISLLVILFTMTGEITLVIWGAVLTITLFGWGALFLIFLQKKLTTFTDNLCQMLDSMIVGGEKPKIDFEAETSLARILHRMERIYTIMQVNRIKVEEEKAALQSLVSDISHQTKTPIANLKMINDTLLTREIPQEKEIEFLLATRSQLDKLDFLIQAMIKTSRLETGIIKLEKKATFSETLTHALNGILAPMEKKQISLDVQCQENLTLYHDSRWTSEALYNLLDNAVKYTPNGGNIHVTVQKWEMYLKIDIIDSGKGIPESEQGSIFKRFYREEAVHDIEGIGIGLYLAREIVTRQGGYIKVISVVGKGSTFSIFMPLK